MNPFYFGQQWTPYSHLAAQAHSQGPPFVPHRSVAASVERSVQGDDASEANDTLSVIQPDNDPFRNPHVKDTGSAISDKTSAWWKELRTNKLSHEDAKDELQPYLVHTSQEPLFRAPELPPQVKSAFKDIRSSLVSQDDRLRESHNHVLRSTMPLLQLFNTLTDPSTPEEVDKSLVLDHVTSALILLGSASQVVALTRQRAFDELLGKRLTPSKRTLRLPISCSVALYP